MKIDLEKQNSEFNFNDVIVRYEILWLLHVFYQSDDNKYNSEIDWIIKDMWYTRNRLVRSHPIVELYEWFEYKRIWIYISNEHLEDIKEEQNRRKNIRNAPILS